MRSVSIDLQHLTLDLLNLTRYPKAYAKLNSSLFKELVKHIKECGEITSTDFPDGFRSAHDARPIFSISIPWLYLKPEEQAAYAKRRAIKAKDVKSSYKNIPLTKLSLEILNKETLGEEIWRRDQRLISALRERLSEPGATAAKAFADGFPKTC